MIKRSHIRQFLAVVDAGNFTQAAARVHVTQPTLSVGIADLEKIVGARLFIREKRRVRLTEAGGRFLPLARNLEQDFRQADAFASQAPVSWPAFRLGALRSVPAPLLQAVVAELAAPFQIELIEGTDSELRAALGGGRIQAALTLLRPGESGAAAIELLDEPYLLMVPDSHRLAGRDSIAPEEVASDIMIARRSCEILKDTSRYFTQRGIRPPFSFRSDNDDRCMAMVASGVGITTAPASLLRDGVSAVALEGYDFSRRIGLICDPGWWQMDGNGARMAEAGARLAARFG